MSDEISFSFSFDLDSAPEPQAAEPAAPLVALHEGDVLTLNANTCLWISKVNGKSFPLANFLLEPLRACTVFRPLDSHIRDMVPRLQGQADEQTLRAIFQSLSEAGLIDESAGFCARFNQSTVLAAPAVAPSRVFVLTCDRSALLERLLNSMMAADLARHEAIYVLDDSRDAAEAGRNRELVFRLSEDFPVPLHYMGDSEKAARLEQLVALEPIHEEALRFFLDRDEWPGQKTYGLARNWALALSAGKRCLMVDDDALCEAYFAPGNEAGVSIAQLPRRVMTYPDEARCREGLVPLGQDPLSAHAEHLGLDLRSSMAKLGVGTLTWEEIEWAGPQERYKLSPASPIIATQSGYIGDPGCPLHPIFLTGDQRVVEALLQVDPDLSLSFSQRQFHICQNRASYLSTANMSLFSGFDNSRMLPPYVPVGRGEDALHGWLLRTLYPASRVMNFNWGTPHLPLENRGGHYSDEPVVPPAGLGMLLDYIQRRIGNAKQTEPGARLEHLAAVARDLAGTGPADLAALLRDEACRYPADLYRNISERSPYFAGYAPDFERYLEFAGQQALAALQNPRPLSETFDFETAVSDDDAARIIGARFERFADALEAWPELWEACRELNSDD